MFTEVQKLMSSRYSGKRNSKFFRKFGYMYRLKIMIYREDWDVGCKQTFTGFK